MLKYYNTNNLRPSINSYEPNEGVNGINQLITNDSSITNYDLLRRSQIVEYAADTSVVKLEKTYWHMKHRQWRRLYRASYGQARLFTWHWFFIYLLLFLIYLVLQIWIFPEHYRDNRFMLETLLLGFMSFVLALISPSLSLMWRLVFLEGYTFFYLFFVSNMYDRPDWYIPASLAIAGIIGFTIVNFFTFPHITRMWYYCTGTLYPKIIVNNDAEGSKNRYEIEHRNLWSNSVAKCVYEGPLEDGRPNGLGTWIDTSYQGELLHGYWKDGRPVGPFESLENDTRNMLVNLRVMFATNAGGRWSLDRMPLSYGIASVESCVSGNFFKGYPMVNKLHGPRECMCLEDRCTCIQEFFKNKLYLHVDDEKKLTSVTISIDKKLRALKMTGYLPKHLKTRKQITVTLERDHITDEKQDYVLAVDKNWVPTDVSEGLLYIHGIDHSLDDAIKRFGQFLALGSFPAHIKPFLFNWPGSSHPIFYWSAQRAAYDTDTHKDLRTFIQSLHIAGIRTLHVMCHSMGTRFFLKAFENLKDLFTTHRATNLTPSNSFLDLREAAMRKTLSSTMLGSSYDSNAEQRTISISNLILLNPDYEVELFRKDYAQLIKYCSNITVYADHRDQALRLSKRLNGGLSLGSHIAALLDAEGNRLDVDIIDASDLDRNMSSGYHSYFNINRVMVDDLHELIVTGKRAEDRTTRLKPSGPVWRFTIVPSSVVIV
jgi:esterase/lipase superfamily enzyme